MDDAQIDRKKGRWTGEVFSVVQRNSQNILKGRKRMNDGSRRKTISRKR